ncbi:MAG: hypothetical protein RIS47_1360, partial [Bacteroidota bacterium]
MLLLVLILVTSNIAISGITFVSIYHNATRTLENTLLDIVKRQKALIYSLMEEGQDKAEILRFLKRMRERHANIGVSGELVIGENEGDSLFFIVSSKRLNMPILGHNQAIGSPMQAATLGNSGVLYGLDYLGVEVVAAYDNIPELKWGIVAKIPMKEVHEPYITAFVATVLVLFVLLSICLVLFDWLSRPIIQQLFRNEEKFWKAIEFAPFPIMLHAESGEVLSISKSWTNKTGYTHADIPTIEAWTRLAYGSKKDILKDTINNLYKLTGPKDEGEFVVNCKDNRQLVWDFSSAPLDLHLDGKRTVISIAMDVTDRKRIEAELLESAYFFKKSQEAAFTGSYKANFETDIWYSSEVLDAIFGIDAAYVRSVEGWLKLIHPDDRAFMAEYLNKEVIQPNAQFDREYRIVRQNDNCVRWVHGLGVVDTNSDGIVKALIGTIQDITERKEYEISLYEKNVEIEAQIEEYRQLNEELAHTKDLIEESEHELKAIYRAASDVAFVSIDYDGKEYTISSFSPGAEKIFGFTAGEILGKPFSTINPAESGINSEDTQEWLTSTPKGIRVEQILVRKNAEIFPAMFTLYPIKTKRNGVRSLLAIAIDITDIKKTQLELI